MENKTEVTPWTLAAMASGFIKTAQDDSGLSMIELAAMFRVAANACDEANQMHERARIAVKMANWRPGQ